MSIQQICSSLLMAAVLWMTTMEAFPIIPSHSATTALTRQSRTFFASAPVVYMSETAEEATASSASSDANPDPVVVPEAAASTTEFEMTPEEAAAKRKVQRNRNTLFVGNLPFGKFQMSYDH
jgi:hypothetical protein